VSADVLPPDNCQCIWHEHLASSEQLVLQLLELVDNLQMIAMRCFLHRLLMHFTATML
jgi:hypothetical protein